MSDQQQVFSDRYELVRHIARGGMAQVYLARDLLLDRPVALKVLFPELSVDPSFVQRFRREAQAAANLAHPNIVAIYDWGQGERTYFIVMEFVDGTTLGQQIRNGPLDAVRAAGIGADVAGALAFAHRRGVIHRDVKPGNVLIDPSGQVKVADFGIARAIGASEGLTQTGAVMGTATYFSPEQAQGYAVDARSDVYSLGVVLYEMVVGRAPFSGDNPVAIAYKHVREQPARPSDLVPSVPAAYEAVVLKALAKEPEDRYQSADELRADLLRFTRGEAVAAPDAVTTVLAEAPAAPVADPTRVARTGAVIVPPGPTGPTRVVDDRPSRAPLVAAIVAAVLILALVGFFIGRHEGLFGGAKTLTVPTGVVGQPAASARAELGAVGFSNVSQQGQQNDTVPSGDVITTMPAPGTRAKSNAPVVLEVSAGPTPVVVPNVVGQTQAVAAAGLAAKQLKVTTTQANSTSVAAGVVISTNPPAGRTIGQGSEVTLTVSDGQAQVTIPSLVGEDPVQAGSKLGGLGLTDVTNATEASSTVAVGKVTRTSPAAGTKVAVNQAVTVYVSSGPAQVAVPNVTGQTAASAESTLSGDNLTFTVVKQPVTVASQDGIVLSQSPVHGASAAPGSSVTLTVGQYSAPTTTSSSTTSTTTPTPPSS